jgi:hypothetical protein
MATVEFAAAAAELAGEGGFGLLENGLQAGRGIASKAPSARPRSVTGKP